MRRDLLLTAMTRFERRRGLFPVDARCACGVGNPLVLVLGSDPVRCYSCDRIARRRPRREAHHVGGRPSPLIVAVPANLHRLLSFCQDVSWRGIHKPASPEAIRIDLCWLGLLGTVGGFSERH